MENNTQSEELKQLEKRFDKLLSNLNLEFYSKINISPVSELSENEINMRMYYETFCENFNQLKLSETHSKTISYNRQNRLYHDAHKALYQLEIAINKILEEN